MTSKNDLSGISQIMFFSLQQALEAPIESTTVFVIGNERLKKDGEVGRYYTVFPSFENFLKNRSLFPHCHELLVDHINNKPDLSGRLVFDFDIKGKNVPSNFKDQVENIIITVIENYLTEIDMERLQFVWSTSKNPQKISKHLTVKNFCFDDWVSLSKLFYQLFCLEWDKHYTWIESSQLIDFQIVRKKASLRMVGSSKIKGYLLVMDNKSDTLEDSLIRVYSEQQKKNEQIVTRNNFKTSIFNLIAEPNLSSPIDANISIIHIRHKDTAIEKPVYDKMVYQEAFKMYNQINPGIFKMGKINGNLMSLLRMKPSKCLMSGKLHEHENAYLIINQTDDMYSIKFGCYRRCTKKRYIYLGSLTKNSLIALYHGDYRPKGNYLKNVPNTASIKNKQMIVDL